MRTLAIPLLLRDPCYFGWDPVTSRELAESFYMVCLTSCGSQGLPVYTVGARGWHPEPDRVVRVDSDAA